MSPYPILRRLSIWAICAAFAAPMPATSEPELDANVAFVSTGGAWFQGDRTGFVRVVVVNGGFEHVTSRIFLQWLTVDRQRGPRIVESMPVASINQPGVWSVGQPAISHEDDITVVRLDATNPYDGEDAVFMLSVKDPGHLGVQRVDRRP